MYKIWEKGTSRQLACIEVGLRRLLLGEEGIYLNENVPGMTEVKEMFYTRLQSTFNKELLEVMSRSGHTSLPQARKVIWQVNESEKIKREEIEKRGEIYRKGMNSLIALYRLRHGYESNHLHSFQAARLITLDEFEGQRTTYLYNEVRAGCVVTVASPSVPRILKHEDSGTGTLRAYAVVGVLRGPDDKLWVITMPMTQVHGHEGLGMAAATDRCVVIELGICVRRAGASHICDDGCKIDSHSVHISHSKGILEGGCTKFGLEKATIHRIWRRIER